MAWTLLVACGRLEFHLMNDATDDVSVDAVRVPGYALAFDGAGYAELPSSGAYLTAAGFSWSLWIRPRNPPTDTTIDYGQTIVGIQDQQQCEDTYLGFGGLLSAARRELAFTVDGAGGCSQRDVAAASYYPAGGFLPRWYHVVAVRDVAANEKLLYVDGVLVSRLVSTATPISRDMIASLGRWYDTGGSHSYFIGDVDELRLYNRALTQGEISGQYAQGFGQAGSSTEPGLIAGFRFDEGSGDRALDYGAGALEATIASAQWVQGIVPLPLP